MQIVIIGSGNVAYHLAKAFIESNSNVVQIFGRNSKELSLISDELKIPFSTQTLDKADLYIIAVSDGAVYEVSKQINNKNCLVVHTSGSVSINELTGDYRKGVLYPLQTFSKSKKLDYSQIPFFIDAEYENDLDNLKKLALNVSERVMPANDEKRKHIHLTAVFACNFVNHLYARAKEISDSQEIPFDYFLPLIDETTHKIHELEPKLAQTGPAVRGDEKTLQLHESLLTNEEQMKIYKTINQSIKKMYHDF